MNIINIIINFLKDYNIYLIYFNTLFIVILLISNIRTKSKLKKISIKYNSIIDCTSDKNLGELIVNNFELSNKIYDKNKELENKVNYIERSLKQCIQKTGIIRYKAFDDVGSDLSFVVAVLDGNDNGIVINGVYARDSCCTYAKGISEGKSKYVLSAEELQALDMAKKQYK